MQSYLDIARKVMSEHAHKPDAPVSQQPSEQGLVEQVAKPRPAHWESADGIVRTGLVTAFGKAGDDEYWLWIESPDRQCWVREDRLRSKDAYDRQMKR
jgi:hypothetical protein